MQLSLLDDNEPEKVRAAKKVRQYQVRIVQEAVTAIRQGKSPLIEMATGTGKTRIGTEIAGCLKDMRVLWLTHRTELIHQASRSLSVLLSEPVGHELPDLHSGNERVVVASKDTIRQPRRLERLRNFRPFDLVVIDEAHHAAARSYLSILDAFPGALRVGLSATPDRFDRARLRCFDTATTPYRIVDAIADGYLVPFKAKRVKVEAVDISGVGLVTGDLNQGQLELVINSERALHGICSGLLEQTGSRPTIVFASGIDNAKRLTEILHRHRSGCARYVTGSTDPDCRRDAFRDFGHGYQYLINVAVATEGTDLPAAACIAMCRPTLSRGLYVQMLGRGSRPEPGLEGDDSGARRSWIRNSSKPDCLVLDFVGNTGRHSVVTVADVAGYDGEVSKRVAKRIAEGELVDVFEALRIEEEREAPARERRKAKAEAAQKQRDALIAEVRLTVTEAQLIGLEPFPKGLAGDDILRGTSDPLSPGQAEEIVRLGLQVRPDLTKAEARKIIVAERSRLGLATDKQLKFLRKNFPDMDLAGMTKKRAKGLFLSRLRAWR